MQYEVEEVRDFVDEGRKSLRVTARVNPLVVYGGTWKLFLDRGMGWVTEMLLRGEVSGKEMGFFLYLVDQMGPGNTINPNQKALADYFGCSVSYVSRVLRGLKHVGLIREGMVNPEVVTKGRTEDYATTLARWHGLGPAVVPNVFGDSTKGA